MFVEKACSSTNGTSQKRRENYRSEAKIKFDWDGRSCAARTYWSLDEAVNEIKSRKKFRSNQKAADLLNSELNGFNNETANKWKLQWEVSNSYGSIIRHKG